MGQFASSTKVSPEKSQQEISALLRKYGCVGFGTYEKPDMGIVRFEMAGGVTVRITVPLPRCSEFERFVSRNVWRTRSPEQARGVWLQAVRQRWRALALAIKAKLECVDSGISTVEQEFMPWVVLPDGRTIGEHVMPRLESLAKDGKLPKLLALPGA